MRGALHPLSWMVMVSAYFWPIDRPPAPTSTFGEYRSRHFHGGLDLSTDQTDGIPVHALEDGQVVRVRASGIGYGRSLYLRMKDGRTAVYGHLDGFAPSLAHWVASVQDSTGQYEQDLEPSAGRFRFRRGEIVGYTGESGAGPPHLHMEVRNGDTGLNPLGHGLPAPDRVPPTITGLWLHPGGPEALIEGAPAVLRVSVRKTGARSFQIARPLRVSGPIRLAVEIYDRTQARSNKMGVAEVAATLDGDELYRASFDSVNWLQTTECEVVFDPRARAEGATLAYALAPPDSLRSYPVKRSRPSWSPPAGDHALAVTAEDAAGNRSRLDATITWVARGGEPPGGWNRPGRHLPRGLEFELGPGSLIARFPRGRGGVPVTRPGLPPAGETPGAGRLADEERVFALPGGNLGAIRLAAVRGESETLEVRAVSLAEVERGWSLTLRSPDGAFAAKFAPGSAFERHPVSVERVAGAPSGSTEPSDPLVSEYRVEPAWLPLRDPISVSLRVPDGFSLDRIGLFGVDGDRQRFVGGRDPADPHLLSGRTRELGSFRALRDDTPPFLGTARVRPPRRPRAPDVRPTPLEVHWAIADAGSGVAPEEVALTVDGRRVAAEYDPERGSIAWRPIEPPAVGSHSYRIEALDRLGNRASQEGEFRVPGPNERSPGAKRRPRRSR